MYTRFLLKSSKHIFLYKDSITLPNHEVNLDIMSMSYWMELWGEEGSLKYNK